MSAALPPVPDLIPISALRKGSNRSNSVSSDYSGHYTPSNNGTYYGDDSVDGADSLVGGGAIVNNNNESDCEEDVQVKDCAPCGSTQCTGEVMGEQRSRRTKQPTAAEVIDTPRSRGREGAAPGASRKTERHRKSDRRRDRDRDRERRKRSNSSKRHHHNNTAAATADSHTHHHHSNSAFSTTSSSSCSDNTSSSPRVNPIFVWVRQKDTHIVEVKCEDYDKRNRILLTKTAQGWRAIPRTETQAPVLQRDDASSRHCKKSRRRSTSKPKRKSFGVQVDESELAPNPDAAWSADEAEATNDQQRLQEERSPPHLLPEVDVNNRECSAGDVSVDASACASVQDDCQNNISPLDNLLAVAELEFNQQIEAERWETTNNKSNEQEDFDMFIESCNASTTNGDKINDEEECCEIDYNDDDDNNLAMDDILSRLEQSLQSPEHLHLDIDNIIKQGLATIANEVEDTKPVVADICEVIQDVVALSESPDTPDEQKLVIDDSLVIKQEVQEVIEIEAKPEVDAIEIIEAMDDLVQPLLPTAVPEMMDGEVEEIPEVQEMPTNSEVSDIPLEAIAIPEEPESAMEEEVPTDLSINTSKTCDPDDDLVPTDLSLPRPKCPSSPQSKRPASQNSETIQSPQPSGIPAIPASPDLYSANKNNAQSNSKSNIYLESLLSPSKDTIVLAEKEPLDLGKVRESDSPKVTCSQEEPPAKKIKLEDITLKTLLDSETVKEDKTQSQNPVTVNKTGNNNAADTPRLLELLTQEEEDEEELDPVAQLKQVLSNNTLNIPDPMLIPKDRLSQILSAPAKEIPKLLKQRPELRLPNVLAFPHLLQDPDILVITLSQLKLIVEKQSQSLPVVEKEKAIVEKEKEKEVVSVVEKERNKVITNPGPRKSSTPPKEKPPVATTPTPSKESREVIKDKEANKKSKISELSSDIDAATNAAFSQMMWLPYLNQMEAMNNPEFLKFLSTMMPGYAPPDMSHMMRPFAPPTFPLPQAPLNYNPLELSMWQESMLQQARAKNQLDYLNSQKLLNKNAISSNTSPSPLGNLHNAYPFQQANVPRSMPQQYQPPPTSSSTNHQAPKYPSKNKSSSSYQQTKQNTYHHQSHTAAMQREAAAAQRKYDNEKLLQQQLQQQQQQQQLQRQKQQQAQQAQAQAQAQQEALQRQEFLKQQELMKQQQEILKQQQDMLKQQQEMYHKPKVACKPFANLVQPHLQALGLFPGLGTPTSSMQQQFNHQQQMEQYRMFQQQQIHQQQQQQQQIQQHAQQQQQQQQQQHLQHDKRNRVSQGPIDLSGGPPTGKLKVRQPQHLVDPKNAARLWKNDDIAEVGSTTSSIDEMQEAQKHLWHPLFGNQKSYTSPWNWTTVTAAGE